MSRLLFPLLAVLVLLALGCDDEGDAPGTGGSGVNPASSGLFPGLYVESGVLATERGGSLNLTAAFPCAALMDMLSAGEWRVTGRADITGLAGVIHQRLLERNGRTAMVRAAGGAAYCTAQVMELSPVPISASGIEAAEGEGRAYPFPGCFRLQEGVVIGLFYEGPGGFWTTVNLAVRMGSGPPVVEEESVEVTMGRASVPVLDIFARAAAEGPSNLPNQRTFYLDPDVSTAAVEVTSEDPLQGTITLKGLIPTDGDYEAADYSEEEDYEEEEDGASFSASGPTQNFQAGFRCG